MKKILQNFSLIVPVVILFSACDSITQTQVAEETSQIGITASYQISDGRLVIPSSSDFSLLMSELNSFEPDMLAEFGKGAEFTSLLESGNELSQDRIYKIPELGIRIIELTRTTRFRVRQSPSRRDRTPEVFNVCNPE